MKRIKLKPGEFRANGDGLAHGRYRDGTPYIRGKPVNDKPKRKAKRRGRKGLFARLFT